MISVECHIKSLHAETNQAPTLQFNLIQNNFIPKGQFSYMFNDDFGFVKCIFPYPFWCTFYEYLINKCELSASLF